MNEIICEVNDLGLTLPSAILKQLNEQKITKARLFYQGTMDWDNNDIEAVFEMEDMKTSFVLPEKVFNEAGIEADEQLHALVYDQAIVIATTAEVYRNISDDIKVLCKALEMTEEETVGAVLSGKIYQEEYEKSDL